jgi:DNA-directed RNA polymerase specialized sigma24 family protein
MKKKPAGRRPQRTVFSVDPKSGSPYISYNRVIRMIHYHVSHYFPALLLKADMEDIVQGMLLKICGANYKPNLCAPATWVTRVMRTKAIDMVNYNNAYGRWAAGIPDKIPDALLTSDTPLYHSETVIDANGTPEDYWIANQEALKEVERLVVRSMKVLVKGKRCVVCGKYKKAHLYYFRDMSKDGLDPFCIKCKRKENKKNYRKRKKLKRKLDAA